MNNSWPLLWKQGRRSEANVEREAPAPVARLSDRSTQTSLSFLQHLLGDYHPRDFAVRLWNGAVWEAEPRHPARFTLVIRHPCALRRMFWPPTELALGEAYVHGDFDIEGEIEGVVGLVEDLFNRRRIYLASHTAGWTFGIHSTASEFAGDDYPDGGDLFSDSRSNEALALSRPL